MSSGPDRALAAERLVFRYPDGDHTAAGLLIDPGTGALFIVTKVPAGRANAIYRLETLATDRINVAIKVTDLPVPLPGDQPATAASAHPCGGGFLLRTGNALYEFRIPPGAPFTDAFRVTPVRVPVGEEVQGEAVSYQADGRAYGSTGPPERSLRGPGSHTMGRRCSVGGGSYGQCSGTPSSRQVFRLILRGGSWFPR